MSMSVYQDNRIACRLYVGVTMDIKNGQRRTGYVTSEYLNNFVLIAFINYQLLEIGLYISELIHHRLCPDYDTQRTEQ